MKSVWTEVNPMASWRLQEAKQRFSEVVRRAIEDGPQIVTRRGEDAVVILSIAEFRKLSGAIPDFKAFLRGAPDLARLDIRRNRSSGRRVKL